MKSKVNKVDVGKLVPVQVDLTNLSDVVRNDAVKKVVYNAKIKDIDNKISNISNLATNTTLNAKINEVQNEIPSITNLATSASLNAKINEVKKKIPSITNLATSAPLNAKTNEVKNKIPSIINLATNTALTAVENEIRNVSNLVKKSDYKTNISEIENKITPDHDHDRYITQELNKLTSENFATRLAQANLASKNDIANFVKRIYIF